MAVSTHYRLGVMMESFAAVRTSHDIGGYWIAGLVVMTRSSCQEPPVKLNNLIFLIFRFMGKSVF